MSRDPPGPALENADDVGVRRHEVDAMNRGTWQGRVRRDELRRGRRLEIMTLGWNAVEAVVSVGAGIAAGSAALIGFGVDSAIESLSGAALLWRLQDSHRGDAREALTLQVVGISFLLLAAYVAQDAVRALIVREAPDPSVPGIVIAALSLLIMPWLAHQKRQVARNIGSRALAADSRQTTLCAYLSAILLMGLVLNALLGWWWSDPVAAVVMVPIIASEGVSALRGERCEDCC
jgi:divalent metal cation (Fe/Co/Zn/Cd) transporter